MAIDINTIADMRMVSRAMREGWSIPEEILPGITGKVIEILAGGNKREQLHAAKLLLQIEEACTKAKQEEVHQKLQENEQRLRLIELARQLPPDELTGLIESSRSASSTD